MKQALEAVAKVVGINLEEAAKITRKQPLFNEEIHIEEELINLEEAIKTYHVAAVTLKQYPKMQKHARGERRLIMVHCIGLISRMIKGHKLPREYTEQDTQFAIHKLVSLLVNDAQKLGYKLHKSEIEKMVPYMTFWQKYQFGSLDFNPMPSLRLIWQKLV